MIGMRLEKFFDPFAVFRKLILKSKKHFNQAQGEHTFCVSGRFARAPKSRGSRSE